MKWKRSSEGWLLIDNSAAGGTKIEVPTFTCAHCQKVTPLDPLRQQPRGYCRQCDRYLCDSPACNGQCRSMERRIDRVLERAARAPSF